GSRTRWYPTSSRTWCMARSPDASLMIAVICSCVSSVRSSRSCALSVTAARAAAAIRPIRSVCMTPPPPGLKTLPPLFLAAFQDGNGRRGHHDAFLLVPRLDPFQELVADVRDFAVLPGAHHHDESRGAVAQRLIADHRKEIRDPALHLGHDVPRDVDRDLL